MTTERPKKKPKTTSAPPAPQDAPTQLVLSRLLTQLASATALLTPIPTTPAALISELEVLLTRTRAFKDALGAGEDESQGLVGERGSWKDELDQRGTLLWNKSTAVKIEWGEAAVDSEQWARVVALLRLVAFHLVALGAIEPLSSIPASTALLALATKATLAILALSPPQTRDHKSCESLLSIAATYAESISTSLPSSLLAGDATTQRIKVVLDHYVARVKMSVADGNLTVARWVMSKAKELKDRGMLAGKEIEVLAQCCLEVGSSLLRLRTGDEHGTDAAAAVEWLLWATQLLEASHSASSKVLQIATLKSLAQAYLDASPRQSKWEQAESVLQELLAIEPAPTLWRRQIKLIIARKGGEGEIVEAFKGAAMSLLWSETEGSRLLSEMYALADDRRALRFSIIDGILDVTLVRMACSTSAATGFEVDSEIGVGAGGFVAQILMSAMFLGTAADRGTMRQFYDKIIAAVPAFQLAVSPAFVCTTYAWRLGDSLYRDHRYDQAAEWYLFGAHPLMRSIEETTWDKTYRKSALCYIEIRQYDKAEEVMGRSMGRDLAKSHFVRFYARCLQRDEASAIDALRLLVSAPDFTLNMLLWSAKAAHESGRKGLLVAVLTSLLHVCKGESVVTVDVDMLALVRCLIRMLIAQLDVPEVDRDETIAALLAHFETSLQVATAISTTVPSFPSLTKNIAWLHKTGFNLCVRLNTNREGATILPLLYTTVAFLMDLETKLGSGSDPATVSRLWLCRFAALSAQVTSARACVSPRDKIQAYRALRPSITALRSSLIEARAKVPHFEHGDDVESAALGLEVEALSAMSDWKGVSRVVEGFDSHCSIKLVKLISERAVSAVDCPADAICSILKRTLNVLYARSDLDTASLSSWLRVIISVFLDRGARDEALQYFSNAVALVKVQAASYPSDELQWLIATAWDQGLDLFSSNSPTKARSYCSIALDLARAGSSPLLRQLEDWFAGLCVRYPVEDVE